MPHVLAAICFGEARLGSPSIVDALMAAGPPPAAAGTSRTGDHTRLSPRERAVLALLAREGEAELTLDEIAHRLGVKTSSVITYVDRLGAKLRVGRGGRWAIVGAARRRGLVA